MVGKTERLKKAFTFEAACDAYLIVKPGASGGVVPATAATDKIIGTKNFLAAESGAIGDVCLSDIPEVRLGGTVLPGDLLTSDANSKAIATTTAGNRVFGVAMAGGVADDIIPYRYGLSQI